MKRTKKQTTGKTIRVFVYGSLLRGFGNHHVLEGAICLGESATRERAFSMYDLGAFPACCRSHEQGERISGECYLVDAEGLEGLDRLEGHPRFYTREPVPMQSGAYAWMYLIDEENLSGRGVPRVIGGSWARYSTGECEEVAADFFSEIDFVFDEYDDEDADECEEELDECDEVSEEDHCDGDCEECGSCLDWSPEPTILYFAYGSNLDIEQMRRRCPSSKLVGSCSLPGTRIAFAGKSVSWGGAVATIYPQTGGRCEGLVYAITPKDMRHLDACEGFPHVYDRRRMTVEMHNGTVCKPWVYILPLTREQGEPSDAYLSKIWDAYKRNAFDFDPLVDAANAA